MGWALYDIHCPIVSAEEVEMNSIRLPFFEFQDCIDQVFSTRDSRQQATKLSQKLLSPLL